MNAVFTPTRARLTVAQFHRMGELGILAPDLRLELVDGEMLTMAPIGSWHAWVVEELGNILRRQVADGPLVWSQNPVRLSDVDELQPDIMLLVPNKGHYRDALPTAHDVLLLIEVSDTTLAYDRETKLPLYAAARVPEVWIINLRDRRLEIYRDPVGSSYRIKLERGARDTVSPLAVPQIAVNLSDILTE
jgi:Uma2 family endonuclease